MYEPPVKKSRDTGLEVEECYQPYGAFVIRAWTVEPYQLHCSPLALGAISIEDAVRATHDFIESNFKNVQYRLFLTQAFEQVHEAPYVVHWGPDGQQVWSGTRDWSRLLKQQEIELEHAKNRKGLELA